MIAAGAVWIAVKASRGPLARDVGRPEAHAGEARA
jgi:hypothetical protein